MSLTGSDRPIYYRIFENDEPYEVEYPISSSDTTLGCIPARLVPPPHSAKNIKKRIIRLENLTLKAVADFYLSADDDYPVDEHLMVDISSHHGAHGPGSSPDSPMVLIINDHRSDDEESMNYLDTRGVEGIHEPGSIPHPLSPISHSEDAPSFPPPYELEDPVRSSRRFSRALPRVPPSHIDLTGHWVHSGDSLDGRERSKSTMILTMKTKSTFVGQWRGDSSNFSLAIVDGEYVEGRSLEWTIITDNGGAKLQGEVSHDGREITIGGNRATYHRVHSA